MADWTQELKDSVVDMYLAATPTAENTTEIVKDIADVLGEGFTSNGVRAILVKAERDGATVYIKKDTSTAAKTEGTKTPRVNKADSIKSLTDLIEGAGLDADSDILSKLTGKAAVYFTDVFEKVAQE